MMVIGNNVVRIGRNGTIHKLIVIRIDCNQIKVIEWGYQFNKRTVQYGFHHIFRRFIVGKSLQNLYIPPIFHWIHRACSFRPQRIATRHGNDSFGECFE